MAFTCPRCGATSHHPVDEAEGYCGRCNDWTGKTLLRETVTAQGQTLYAPVLACRPVRPEDYPPARLRLWRGIAKDVGVEAPIYPGSTYQPCEDCGIQVAVGPRQQEAISTANSLGLLAHVCCMIDASVRASAPDIDEVVRTLGNPFAKKKP